MKNRRGGRRVIFRIFSDLIQIILVFKAFTIPLYIAHSLRDLSASMSGALALPWAGEGENGIWLCYFGGVEGGREGSSFDFGEDHFIKYTLGILQYNSISIISRKIVNIYFTSASQSSPPK